MVKQATTQRRATASFYNQKLGRVVVRGEYLDLTTDDVRRYKEYLDKIDGDGSVKVPGKRTLPELADMKLKRYESLRGDAVRAVELAEQAQGEYEKALEAAEVDKRRKAAAFARARGDYGGKKAPPTPPPVEETAEEAEPEEGQGTDPNEFAEAFERLGACAEVATLAGEIAKDGTKADILDALDLAAPGHGMKHRNKLADLGEALLEAVSTWS